MSKLPKIRDEERESQFGYVHGVSGPGQLWLPHVNIKAVIFRKLLFPILFITQDNYYVKQKQVRLKHF